MKKLSFVLFAFAIAVFPLTGCTGSTETSVITDIPVEDELTLEEESDEFEEGMDEDMDEGREEAAAGGDGQE